MFAGVFGVPVSTLLAVVVWYVNPPSPAGGLGGGAGAQLRAGVELALMIAANAVAGVPPTCTERLRGRTAATVVAGFQPSCTTSKSHAVSCANAGLRTSLFHRWS